MFRKVIFLETRNISASEIYIRMICAFDWLRKCAIFSREGVSIMLIGMCTRNGNNMSLFETSFPGKLALVVIIAEWDFVIMK